GQARRFIRAGLGVGAGRDVTHSGLTRFSAFQCHETWAIAFDAGEVLVARGLIDASLRTPRGLQWLYGQTVRRLRAVPAALTDFRMYEGAPGGVGVGASLAPTALLGGTGLVINQNRGAFHFAQLLLDGVQLITMVDWRLAVNSATFVFLRFFRHHNRVADSFRCDLGDDGRHG